MKDLRELKRVDTVDSAMLDEAVDVEGAGDTSANWEVILLPPPTAVVPTAQSRTDVSNEEADEFAPASLAGDSAVAVADP